MARLQPLNKKREGRKPNTAPVWPLRRPQGVQAESASPAPKTEWTDAKSSEARKPEATTVGRGKGTPKAPTTCQGSSRTANLLFASNWMETSLTERPWRRNEDTEAPLPQRASRKAQASGVPAPAQNRPGCVTSAGRRAADPRATQGATGCRDTSLRYRRSAGAPRRNPTTGREHEAHGGTAEPAVRCAG